jgi:hypothetical protein
VNRPHPDHTSGGATWLLAGDDVHRLNTTDPNMAYGLASSNLDFRRYFSTATARDSLSTAAMNDISNEALAHAVHAS